MIDHTFMGNLFAWACQVALLVAVSAVAIALLRIDVPSLRYACWRLVLAACFVLPLAQRWNVSEVTVSKDVAIE